MMAVVGFEWWWWWGVGNFFLLEEFLLVILMYYNLKIKKCDAGYSEK